MPAGLQVFDENGNVTLNLADRVARAVGSFSCPGAPNKTQRNYTYQIPASIVQQGAPFIWHSETVYPSSYYYYDANINIAVNTSGLITVSLYTELGTIPAFSIYYGVM